MDEYVMKTVRKITEELAEYNDWESTETILREWAISIINKCSKLAEVYYSEPTDAKWPDREIYNPQKVKRLL